jgi:DNA-binding NarL/FixJ family response regulator
MSETLNTTPPHSSRKSLRVVVADDDAFTASLVAGGLRAQGFIVFIATTTSQAWDLVSTEDPHALVSDLNFGIGESGAALLRRVQFEYPWVGLVVLTSHVSPELAVEDSTQLPPSLVYLVKSHLREVEELAIAVSKAIAGIADDARPATAHSGDTHAGELVLTAAQADALRMLAAGASTKAIAQARGTTVRAAETMLVRLYVALGVDSDESSNPRVAAVHLWERGQITVK